MPISQRLAAELAALDPLDTEALWAQGSALETLTSGHNHTEFSTSTGLCCKCSSWSCEGGCS